MTPATQPRTPPHPKPRIRYAGGYWYCGAKTYSGRLVEAKEATLEGACARWTEFIQELSAAGMLWEIFP